MSDYPKNGRERQSEKKSRATTTEIRYNTTVTKKSLLPSKFSPVLPFPLYLSIVSSSANRIVFRCVYVASEFSCVVMKKKNLNAKLNTQQNNKKKTIYNEPK